MTAFAFRKKVLLVALVSMLFTSVSASPNHIALTPTSNPGQYGFLDTSVAGSFSDYVVFTVAGGSVFSVWNVFSILTNTSDVLSLTTSLYQGDLSSLLNAGSPLLTMPISSGTFNQGSSAAAWQTAGAALDVGTYTLQFSGSTASTNAPGYVWGTLNSTGTTGATILPSVPEPSESAMLMAGLGLMAFVARRRARARTRA